jgi:hypothetical protein
MLQPVYGKVIMNRTQVFVCVKRFKVGRKNITVYEGSSAHLDNFKN